MRKHNIDCTEDERAIRKRGILKIQDEIVKKKNKTKNINKTKRIIDFTNKEIEWCDKTKFLKTTPSSKIKLCRKLGKYLVYNGKGKQGLEYLRLAKSYTEDLYEGEHPKTLNENILYNKMYDLVHHTNSSSR